MTINKQFNYLRYSEENIDEVPEVTGVYAFFSVGKSWLYVGSAGAGRLRARIKEHWTANEWPDVYYFRWFQADSEQNARDTEADWIKKHDPRHNPDCVRSPRKDEWWEDIINLDIIIAASSHIFAKNSPRSVTLSLSAEDSWTFYTASIGLRRSVRLLLSPDRSISCILLCQILYFTPFHGILVSGLVSVT